jgi:uncharacterized protein YndB with AHSA1/START domain
VEALTDATELTRWFPLGASVVPGAGGVIRMRWDESYDAESRIEIWEPNRHLRIGFPHHPPFSSQPTTTSRADKGRTILRVVTSGFGEGNDWTIGMPAWASGWDFELRGLKHYLEHHRGQDRLVASARHALTISRESAWERLTGPDGWLERTGLTGATVFRSPPIQLVMTVDQLNNGILRLELEFGNRAIAWLATWDASPEAVEASTSSGSGHFPRPWPESHSRKD